MRSTPLTKLPDGFKEVIKLGRYTFFKNDKNKIIWKRNNNPYFILSLEMTTIPQEERFMFWHDKTYRAEVNLKSLHVDS